MSQSLIKRQVWKEEVVAAVRLAVEMAGSRHALARHLGTQYQSVLSWLRGATPSDENMKKIEQFIAKKGGSHD